MLLPHRIIIILGGDRALEVAAARACFVAVAVGIHRQRLARQERHHQLVAEVNQLGGLPLIAHFAAALAAAAAARVG